MYITCSPSVAVKDHPQVMQREHVKWIKKASKYQLSPSINVSDTGTTESNYFNKILHADLVAHKYITRYFNEIINNIISWRKL